MKPILVLVGAAVIGALALIVIPNLTELAPVQAHEDEHAHQKAPAKAQPELRVEDHANDPADDHAGRTDDDDHDAALELTDEQLKLANITLAKVKGGDLHRHILVPGSIVPDADRIARVSVRLLGTVAELRKRLGDQVAQGEVVAVIESREVADAKSEYLAALSTNALEQTMLDRSRTLYESKTTSENAYLRARATAEQAKIKLDAARQKLAALGLDSAEIAALSRQPVEALRRQELRAPIAGRIAQRRADLGALVGREGQESELFVIVDLDRVWVELAVPPADLPRVREGQAITVRAGGSHVSGGHAADGLGTPAKIVFVSPLLDAETRNARVVASLDNTNHEWRPGTYVTAEIPVGDESVSVIVPKSALQSVKGRQTVFVRRGGKLEARTVQLGRDDDDKVEILSGLADGETIAVTNTFTLKAELGKSEAEHAH